MQPYIQNSVWKDDISGLLDPDETPQLQFLLDDTSRFVRTHRFNKRSTIYQENGTNRFWYRDDFHRTHFEVFNSTGDHIGEASLDDGILDTSKRDSAKSLIL